MKTVFFQQFPVTWEKAYVIMVSENVGYKFYIKYPSHIYNGSQLFVICIEKNTYKIIKNSNSDYIVDGL